MAERKYEDSRSEPQDFPPKKSSTLDFQAEFAGVVLSSLLMVHNSTFDLIVSLPQTDAEQSCTVLTGAFATGSLFFQLFLYNAKAVEERHYHIDHVFCFHYYKKTPLEAF